MSIREKHSEEPTSIVRMAQQHNQATQAGMNAPLPVMWQASSVRVLPVLGNPAGILRIQQLKGNRAVGQMLAVQQSAEAQGLREPSDEEIHSAAAEGIRTPATTLPFLDRIQASFGYHSIDHVKAHVGPEAAKASRAMNALAFASGDHVVFGGTPDLHTAAHEAAHIIQQQAGVQLAGRIGREGDAYEYHAEAVADAVVAGQAADELLAVSPPGARPANIVQRYIADKEWALPNTCKGSALKRLDDEIGEIEKSVGEDEAKKIHATGAVLEYWDSTEGKRAIALTATNSKKVKEERENERKKSQGKKGGLPSEGCSPRNCSELDILNSARVLLKKNALRPTLYLANKWTPCAPCEQDLEKGPDSLEIHVLTLKRYTPLDPDKESKWQDYKINKGKRNIGEKTLPPKKPDPQVKLLEEKIKL